MFQFMRSFIDGIHDDQVTKDMEILNALSDKQPENSGSNNQRNRFFAFQNGDLDDNGFDSDFDPILNSRVRPNQFEQRYLDDYDTNNNRRINPFLINKLNRRTFLNMLANRQADQAATTRSSTKMNLLNDFLELNNRQEYEKERLAFNSDTKINAFGGLSLWQLAAIIFSILMFIAFSFWLLKRIRTLREKFKRSRAPCVFEQSGRFSRTKSVSERNTSSQNLLPTSAERLPNKLHGEKNKTFINESTTSSSTSTLANDTCTTINMKTNGGESLTHLIPKDFPDFYLFGSANKVLMNKQLKMKMENRREREQHSVHFSDEIVNKVGYFM